MRRTILTASIASAIMLTGAPTVFSADAVTLTFNRTGNNAQSVTVSTDCRSFSRAPVGIAFHENIRKCNHIIHFVSGCQRQYISDNHLCHGCEQSAGRL